MIVTCEECSTRFNLNDNMVKPSGSKVKCSKCHKVFKVYPPASTPPQLSATEEPSIELSQIPHASTNIPPADKMLSHIDDNISLQPLAPSPSSKPEEVDFPDLDIQLQPDEKKGDFAAKTSQIGDINIPDIGIMLHPSDMEPSYISGETQFDDIEIPDIDALSKPFNKKTDTTTAETQLSDFDIPDIDVLSKPSVKKADSATTEVQIDDFDMPDIDVLSKPSIKKADAALGDFDILDLDTLLKPSLEKMDTVTEESQIDDFDIPDIDALSKPPIAKTASKTLEGQVDDLDIPDIDDLLKPSTEKTEVTPQMPPHRQPEHQEASFDDLDTSLNLDISDLLLNTSTDVSSLSEAGVKDAGGSGGGAAPHPASKPFEDTIPDAFSDIEPLDLSNLESLLDKQETAAVSDKPVGERLSDIPLSNEQINIASSGQEHSLEEDHFLSFEELQLDTDFTDAAVIAEKKEAAQNISPVPGHSSHEAPHGDTVIMDQPLKSTQADEGIENDDENTDVFKAPPKKRMNTSLLITLLIILLGAGGYGLYTLLDSMGIHIVNSPAHKVQDPGNLKITPFDINSKFLDNTKIGKIFVITGKVKNEYPMNRGAIQVTGKLYTKDKKMAKAETVFCGNILSDIDITNLDAAAIQQRLQNRMGDNHINVQVKPGSAIPFMIIFTNLPDNLDEFTLEVNASAPS